MGTLSSLTLGDVVRALRRYRPIAVGVAVLLVVFAVLPEPAHVEGALADSRSLLDQTRADSSGAAPTSATLDSVPSAAPGVSDTVTFEPSFEPSPTSSDPGFSDSSSSSTFDSSDSAFPSADDPVETFDGPSIDSDTSTTGQPLRIVASTWASRAAGTPVAKDGVPEGTLPVSFRVTDDKRSYVRLSGSQKTLTLTEDPAGARATSGPAVIQICPVTSAAWAEGEAIAIDGSPTWDAGMCVLGIRGDTGAWTFDMSSFPSVDDARGFALVPGEGGGLDFQVAFKKTAGA